MTIEEKYEDLERRVAALEYYRTGIYDEERARINALAFGQDGGSLPFSDATEDEAPPIVSVGKHVAKVRNDKGEVGWVVLWSTSNRVSYAVVRKLGKTRVIDCVSYPAGTYVQSEVKTMPSTFTVLELKWNPFHDECESCG